MHVGAFDEVVGLFRLGRRGDGSFQIEEGFSLFGLDKLANRISGRPGTHVQILATRACWTLDSVAASGATSSPSTLPGRLLRRS
jgi:hypothetical protein